MSKPMVRTNNFFRWSY